MMSVTKAGLINGSGGKLQFFISNAVVNRKCLRRSLLGFLLDSKYTLCEISHRFVYPLFSSNRKFEQWKRVYQNILKIFLRVCFLLCSSVPLCRAQFSFRFGFSFQVVVVSLKTASHLFSPVAYFFDRFMLSLFPISSVF